MTDKFIIPLTSELIPILRASSEIKKGSDYRDPITGLANYEPQSNLESFGTEGLFGLLKKYIKQNKDSQRLHPPIVDPPIEGPVIEQPELRRYEYDYYDADDNHRYDENTPLVGLNGGGGEPSDNSPPSSNDGGSPHESDNESENSNDSDWSWHSEYLNERYPNRARGQPDEGNQEVLLRNGLSIIKFMENLPIQELYLLSSALSVMYSYIKHKGTIDPPPLPPSPKKGEEDLKEESKEELKEDLKHGLVISDKWWTVDQKNKAEEYVNEVKQSIPEQCYPFVSYDKLGEMRCMVMCTDGRMWQQK